MRSRRTSRTEAAAVGGCCPAAAAASGDEGLGPVGGLVLAAAAVAMAFVVAPPALAADQSVPLGAQSGTGDDREHLKRKLQETLDRLDGKPDKRGGAHGKQDPHAALAPEALVRVALQHQAEGRPDHAVSTLNDALRRYPGNPRLLTVRGSLLLQQDKTADALRDLEAAAQAAPDDPAILVNRAQGYRRFGDRTRALADLDRAIEIDPDFVAARFNRGSMHFNAQRFDAALVDFEHCVTVDPHAPPPYFNLAITREQLGDRSSAAADLRRFLELTDTKAWRELAEKRLAALEAAEPAASRGD